MKYISRQEIDFSATENLLHISLFLGRLDLTPNNTSKIKQPSCIRSPQKIRCVLYVIHLICRFNYKEIIFQEHPMTGFVLNTLKILFTRLFRILLSLSKCIPSEAVKFRSVWSSWESF